MKWWVAFSAKDYLYVEPVEWLAQPSMNADAYAANRLWQLSRAYDPVIPPPPAGSVLCAVYDNDPELLTPVTLLGQAGRMFRPSDAVKQDV